jgi:hypothetical protein
MAVVLKPLPSFAESMAGFVQTIPLTAISDAKLDQPADLVKMGRGSQAFLALGRLTGKAPGGRILFYDAQAMAPGQSLDLPHDVETLAFDAGANRLFVAGNKDDTFHISAIDVESRTVQSVILAGRTELPALALSPDGRIFTGGSTGNAIRVVSREAFAPAEIAADNFKRGQAVPTEVLFYPGEGGVKSIAVSADGKVFFVSDAREPRAIAVEVGGKQARVDSIEVGSTNPNANASIPLVMRAETSPETRKGDLGSLILADYGQQRLIVTDFDPSFMTLNVVTDSPFRLPPAADVEAAKERAFGLRESPLLLSTNTDQSTILVGSRESRTLQLFGRNSYALEIAREFNLQAPPESLDVSDDGKIALIIQSGRTTISRLSEDKLPDIPAIEKPSPAKSLPRTYSKVNDRTASEDIRELQRKLADRGFAIGAVDGTMGNRTKRALSLALKKSGAYVDRSRFDSLSKEEIQQILKALDTLK